MKQLILIKLGGSVLTDKNVELSLRESILHRLSTEIAAAKKLLPEARFIIGHGHGSYGHVPAKKYRTVEGFINQDSKKGMAAVLDSVNELNHIVTRALFSAGLNAISYRLTHTLITDEGRPDSFNLDVLEHYLLDDFVPITCGDVMTDISRGCCLWSTEKILSFIQSQLEKKDWHVSKVLQVTDVAGVLDGQAQTIKKISNENWPEMQQYIRGISKFDVSGGMSLKINESLQLADKGIQTMILSGLEPDNVYNALVNHEWHGTLIS